MSTTMIWILVAGILAIIALIVIAVLRSETRSGARGAASGVAGAADADMTAISTMSPGGTPDCGVSAGSDGGCSS